MAYTLPTLEETHELLLADFGNRFPTHDVSRYSDNWKRLRTLAMAITGLHAHLAVVNRDLLPDRAAGEDLDAHGDVYGVARKLATVASKADALRCYGTAASTVTDGDQLTAADGTVFEVNQTATIGAGATYVDVDIIAVTAGSVGRKETDETLTFTSPPAGIQPSAVLQLDIDEGGQDIEADSDYRTRILERIAYPGMGGNATDYKAWAEEQEGVAHAYVYPLRDGLGTVDVAALHSGSGSLRLLSAGEIATLLAILDELRPVAIAGFRVLTVTAEPCNEEITLVPEGSGEGDVYAPASLNEFDWDDSTPPTVTSWTAGTRVLKMSARPAAMVAGDRIVHKRSTSTLNDGHELVVESLGPAADEVTLVDDDELATAPPEAGTTLYSGGPLVEPVRLAELAVIDALGPGRGDYAQGAWDGTLRVSAIFKAAQLTAGVLDSLVILPAANVPGTNAVPGSTVGLVTPGRILVRRAW